MFDSDHRPRGDGPEGPDDPDAPPTEGERQRAAALREELSADPAGPEAAWLLAHLRQPTEDDLLGDLRARGLSRAARETLQARQAQVRAQQARRGSWQRVGRSLYGTAGLLAAAALMLVVASVLMDQSYRGAPRPGPSAGLLHAELLRTSLRRHESPSRRLDLVLDEQLSALRQRGYRGGARALMTRGMPGQQHLPSASSLAASLGALP